MHIFCVALSVDTTGSFCDLVRVLLELGQNSAAESLLKRAQAVSAFSAKSKDTTAWWGPSGLAGTIERCFHLYNLCSCGQTDSSVCLSVGFHTPVTRSCCICNSMLFVDDNQILLQLHLPANGCPPSMLQW